MIETKFMISDAAKQVGLETHVLRYWEVELKLPIKRTELGHRYYTNEDIEIFKDIKNLKEQGLQLKAIRILVLNGTIKSQGFGNKTEKEHLLDRDNNLDVDKAENLTLSNNLKKTTDLVENDNLGSKVMFNSNEILHKNSLEELRNNNELGDEKFYRLQMLLKDMIGEVVKENNRELCEEIKGSILKEMDYQFRLQEERDEAHYKRVDEQLRSKVVEKEKTKRRKHSFF